MNNFFVNSPRHKIKPIFLGDEKVGKTTIITNYTNTVYNNDTKVDLYTKNIELLDEKVNLMIFDVKGHHCFEKIIIPYIKDVNAFIIVFDLTCLSSFYNIGEWINKIKKYNNNITSDKYYPILLIGNKRDLEKERIIKYEEAERYAVYNKLLYIEFSKDDNLIRLNMILETYFYKILTLNNDDNISYNLNYKNIFNDKKEKNKEKKDIDNKNKLLTSKSIDNIEILDDKYKSNKFYHCNKFINKYCIF
jgi:Ras-related protein Rab-6A